MVQAGYQNSHNSHNNVNWVTRNNTLYFLYDVHDIGLLIGWFNDIVRRLCVDMPCTAGGIVKLENNNINEPINISGDSGGDDGDGDDGGVGGVGKEIRPSDDRKIYLKFNDQQNEVITCAGG